MAAARDGPNGLPLLEQGRNCNSCRDLVLIASTTSVFRTQVCDLSRVLEVAELFRWVWHPENAMLVAGEARLSGSPIGLIQYKRVAARAYSRSLKNLARQLSRNSYKSACRGSQRPIRKSGAKVGVRGFLRERLYTRGADGTSGVQPFSHSPTSKRPFAAHRRVPRIPLEPPLLATRDRAPDGSIPPMVKLWACICGHTCSTEAGDQSCMPPRTGVPVRGPGVAAGANGAAVRAVDGRPGGGSPSL